MSEPVKSHPVPSVGDIVNLNNHGLETIYGTRAGLAHMKSLPLVITKVGKTSLTEPEQTFEVEVDNKEINAFLIDHWCFDIVGSTKEELSAKSSMRALKSRLLGEDHSAGRLRIDVDARLSDDTGVAPPPEPPKSEDWGSF